MKRIINEKISVRANGSNVWEVIIIIKKNIALHNQLTVPRYQLIVIITKNIL